MGSLKRQTLDVVTSPRPKRRSLSERPSDFELPIQDEGEISRTIAASLAENAESAHSGPQESKARNEKLLMVLCPSESVSTCNETRSDDDEVIFLGSNALSPGVAGDSSTGPQLGSTTCSMAGQEISSLALRPAVGEQSRDEQEVEVADEEEDDVVFIGQLSLEINAAMPFRYHQLDTKASEIRLVYILPGLESDEVVQCQLVHIRTDKPKKKSYQAVSYTWGHQNNGMRIIKLNGLDFPVRENLYQALLHLRFPDSSRSLWIDALCINQIDVAERNEQVAKMGNIYSRATEVIVWLGVKAQASDTALSAIERLSSQADISYWMHDFRFKPERLAISVLTKREYWKRIWIIQEIFRARKIWIQCGGDRLEWSILAKLFRKITSDDTISSSGIAQVLRQSLPAQLNEYRRSDKASRSLIALLEMSADSLSSDPRDKLFALFGLAGDVSTCTTFRKPLVVDYSKTVFELYEYVMELYNGDDTMRLSQLLMRCLREPLPDMHGRNRAECLSQKPPHHSFHKEVHHFILAKGNRAGRIMELSPASNCWPPSALQFSRWFNTCSSIPPHEKHKLSKDYLDASLCSLGQTDRERLLPTNIMICKDDEGKTKSTPYFHGSDTMKDFLKSIEQHELPRLFPDADSPIAPPRVFLTRTGAWGFVPWSAAQGDVIYKFPDCDIACVLRPILDALNDLAGFWILGRAIIANCGDEATTAFQSSNMNIQQRGLHLMAVPEVELLLSASNMQVLTW